MKTDPESDVAAYGVGSGILLIQACALFPGLLPCLLLLLPFVLPLVVLGLVAAILAAPVYGLWRLGAWALERRSVRLSHDRLTPVPN
ncbi:MAG TPA: hypothetical protein VH256_01955 [Thermoleophilaceae bacterium]|jgi:hypothetical protein|nr:hypothetical protein [Thermoleophilaceae bacterium]